VVYLVSVDAPPVEHCAFSGGHAGSVQDDMGFENGERMEPTPRVIHNCVVDRCATATCERQFSAKKVHFPGFRGENMLRIALGMRPMKSSSSPDDRSSALDDEFIERG
jgi:hypothetical protein